MRENEKCESSEFENGIGEKNGEEQTLESQAEEEEEKEKELETDRMKLNGKQIMFLICSINNRHFNIPKDFQRVTGAFRLSS